MRFSNVFAAQCREYIGYVLKVVLFSTRSLGLFCCTAILHSLAVPTILDTDEPSVRAIQCFYGMAVKWTLDGETDASWRN